MVMGCKKTRDSLFNIFNRRQIKDRVYRKLNTRFPFSAAIVPHRNLRNAKSICELLFPKTARPLKFVLGFVCFQVPLGGLTSVRLNAFLRHCQNARKLLSFSESRYAIQ
jgi:hypothetical protein